MSRWVKKARPNGPHPLNGHSPITSRPKTNQNHTVQTKPAISKRPIITNAPRLHINTPNPRQSVDLSTYYAQPLSRCNRRSTNKQLDYDVNYLFANQCAYIPKFFVDPELTIFNALKRDIIQHHEQMNDSQNNVCHLNKITLPNEKCYNLQTMSDHQKKAMNVRLQNDRAQAKRESNDVFKASIQCYIERNVYEMPQRWSLKAKEVADELCRHYKCELIVCSMNFYKNGQDFAKFHFDKYAYHKGHENKPDITIGASFGCTRTLAFQAMADRKFRVSIPQHNGDVFSFSDRINERFKHSIPQISQFNKERISIIVWGKRRKNINRNVNINGRNGSKPGPGARPQVNATRGRQFHSRRQQAGPKRW